MGFLLGAYGKLAAGSRYRSIQARLMRISSKLKRVTRQVGDMEKMIDRQQKSMEESLRNQNTMMKAGYQQVMSLAMQTDDYKKAVAQMQNPQGLSNEDIQKYSTIISQAQAAYNSQVSSVSAYLDSQAAMSKSQIENYVEQLRDSLLEPLKDEEDSLQLEKDTLESQRDIALQDYQACQKMEQSDAKMFQINYTASQG